MNAWTAIVLTLAAPLALAQHEHHQHVQDPQQEEPAHPGGRAQEDEHAAQGEHSRHAEHGARPADQPTESERRHIPPEPPQLVLGDISPERMIELMAMDDAAPRSMLQLDQFEWTGKDGEDALSWEAQAWYGGDYNKVWFKTEGEYVDDRDHSRNELLWDRVAARWWSLQAGVRHDLGEGPSRTWAAFGLQGLAPYWWEVEATAYVGEQGRTALRLAAEQDVLLTQRLILQPEMELEFYGKDDPRNGIGSGLADAELALRLRYEIRREFAPYIGVAWSKSWGDTADYARAAGDPAEDTRLIAGFHMWF